MFDRIGNSFALARSSWQVLQRDKQLLVFPIFSGIGCLVILLSFVLPFALHREWVDFLNNGQGIRRPPPWFYIVAFAFYFCNYFVIVFCNAALISCTLMRFHGETPTVADGFRAALLRLPQILAWAAVSATVGVLLKAVENANERVGAFISALLGTAWTVLTFFVVPVLVVEKVGPVRAVQRSMAILRKTWGEALVGSWSLGFYMLLLALPGIALLLLGGILFIKAPLVGGAVIALAVIYFLVHAAISSALDGIYLGALYQYAAYGEIPRSFDRDVMEKAFVRKK